MTRLRPTLTFALGVLTMVLSLVSPPTEAAGQDFSSPEYDLEIPDLEGTWGLRTVLTAVSDPPMVGKITNRTITHLKVTVEQDDLDLTLHTEVCDVRMTSDFKRIRTVLPEAFVDAIPDAKRTGRLRKQGDRWAVEVDKHVSVLGANLRQPADEYLPDEADDHRVVDADDDGHPGVTVRVEGMINGKLYLVQRGWEQFSGSLEADGDRISGLVQWDSEQKILGSTSIFLGKQPPTEPHPDERLSRFEMRRVDGDVSCGT